MKDCIRRVLQSASEVGAFKRRGGACEPLVDKEKMRVFASGSRPSFANI